MTLERQQTYNQSYNSLNLDSSRYSIVNYKNTPGCPWPIDIGGPDTDGLEIGGPETGVFTPILNWAFWSNRNSFVAVRSDTRFSSSCIWILNWWFSSWNQVKINPNVNIWLYRNLDHLKCMRWWGTNWWTLWSEGTFHICQTPSFPLLRITRTSSLIHHILFKVSISKRIWSSPVLISIHLHIIFHSIHMPELAPVFSVTFALGTQTPFHKLIMFVLPSKSLYR